MERHLDQRLTDPLDGARLPVSSASARRRTSSRWPWVVTVGVAAFVAYLPSLGNGYTLDDVAAVQQDPRLRPPAGVLELLFVPYLHDVPAARSPYRPITTLSYALSWRVAGGHPLAFHLFNVTGHAAATLLVLGLLLKLGAAVALAGPAALLFAVHPVHVEAVANIVGRADVLVTLFCLLGVWLHLTPGLHRFARLGGIALAYLLAVGAKENGYVLPLLILLIEMLRPARQAETERVSWSGRLRRAVAIWPVLATMAVTLAGYLVVRRAVLGSVIHLDVAAYIAVLPTWLRVTTAVANLTEVARLLVFPADLSWHYGPAVINPAGPTDLRFWVGLATCAAVGLIVARSLRDGPDGRWALIGVGWIALSFVLLSNLLVPMPTWLGERTLYLPSVGVAALVVAVLELVRRRTADPSVEPGGRRTRPWRPTLVAAVAVTVLTLLGGARTWQYSRVWESSETLFTDLVERHPESFQASRWIGLRMVDAGQIERGLVWLERAVDLNPTYVMVRLDYARALLLAGRATEAEEVLRPIPKELHPSTSVYLAQSFILQDRIDEARSVVEEGLRFFPQDGRLLEQRRQLEEGG